MDPEKALLTKIEAFLKATNTQPTQFGLDAINDGKLVFELRNGRQIRRETRERIEAHMTAKAAEMTAQLRSLGSLKVAS